MPTTTTTYSAAGTRRLGRKLAGKISGGGPVCFYGDLGAGKTTLIQGIARGLGIRGRVISPTFIIARRYKIPAKKRFLWHIDLYRLDGPEDIKPLGIQQLWQDPANILLIEWPERAAALLPEKRWEIQITAVGENKRKISYEALH